MKKNNESGSYYSMLSDLFLPAFLFLAATIPQVSYSATYEPGFKWNKLADYTNGTVANSTIGNPDTDSNGIPTWSYEWIDARGLAADAPWYLNQTQLMSWAKNPYIPEYWAIGMSGPTICKWDLNTPSSKDGYGYVPVVRWTNPTGQKQMIRMAGSFALHWYGVNSGSPYLFGSPSDDVVVVGSYNASTGQTKVLYSGQFSKPGSGETSCLAPNYDDCSHVNINIDQTVEVGPNDSIFWTHRALTSYTDRSRWVTMNDHNMVLSIAYEPSVLEPAVFQLNEAAGSQSASDEKNVLQGVVADAGTFQGDGYFHGDGVDNCVVFDSNNTSLLATTSMTLEAIIKPTGIGTDTYIRRIFAHDGGANYQMSVWRNNSTFNEYKAPDGVASIAFWVKPTDSHGGLPWKPVLTDYAVCPIVSDHWYKVKTVWDSLATGGIPAAIFVDDQGVNGDNSGENWSGYKNCTDSAQVQLPADRHLYAGDQISSLPGRFTIGCNVNNSTLNAFNGLIDRVTINPGAQSEFSPDKFYAVEPSENAQRVISIDPVTLEVRTALTLQGSTGFKSYSLAFSPGGELYGWDASVNQLYKIDVTTGQVTHIGAPAGIAITGLAFDRQGKLYGLMANDALYSINITTGAVAQIGQLGVDIRANGLAINFWTNDLYAVSGGVADYLLKLNKATGAASIIGSLGVNYPGVGTEFNPVTGELYAIRNNGSVLMKVDLNTGVGTEVGALNGIQAVSLAAKWPLVVTAPPAVTVEATGTLTTVTTGVPTAAGGDGGYVITSNAPAAFPVGTTIIIWTVKDAAGKSVSVNQVVTVRATTPLVVTAPPAVTVEATGTLTNVTTGVPTAAGGDGGYVITSNAPAAFPVGTTTITWTVKDAAGRTASVTQIVTVRAPLVVTAPPAVIVESTGETVSDTVKQEENVRDITPPDVAISISPSSGPYYTSDSIKISASATDKSDPNPVMALAISNNGATANVISAGALNLSAYAGVNLITLVATDKSGNKASKTAQLDVVLMLAEGSVKITPETLDMNKGVFTAHITLPYSVQAVTNVVADGAPSKKIAFTPGSKQVVVTFNREDINPALFDTHFEVTGTFMVNDRAIGFKGTDDIKAANLK